MICFQILKIFYNFSLFGKRIAPSRDMRCKKQNFFLVLLLVGLCLIQAAPSSIMTAETSFKKDKNPLLKEIGFSLKDSFLEKFRYRRV